MPTTSSESDPSTSADSAALAQQAAALFVKAFGNQPGARLAHAKGIVCEGTFEPAKGAAEVSKAAHFNGEAVPVTVRFRAQVYSISINRRM